MLILVMSSQYTAEGTVVLRLAQRIGMVNVLGLTVVGCFLSSHF